MGKGIASPAKGDPMAERPIECNQCRKPIKISYKEIKGSEINQISACADCPKILCRLNPAQSKSKITVSHDSLEHTSCPRCHRTSDEIKMGNYMGCSECYSVFEQLIVDQLSKLKKIKEIPSKSTEVKLHKGRSHEVSPQGKGESIGDLNSALSDAIKGENFEQAAWLRDRINTLMEEPHE